MSTLVTEFEDERNNRRFLLEIEFDYEEPERFQVGDHWDSCPGQLLLNSVEVLEIKAYNADGDVVLSGVREGLNDVFDPTAYALVLYEIDHWGSLADEMVEAA